MLKKIANAPFGMYILRLAWIYLHLLPEYSDMYIHRSDIPRILIAPYKIQKILSSIYLVGIIHEQF